jgi:hypothetical protein
MEAVGIEQAETAAKVLVADLRKNLINQDAVAITFVDVDVRPRTDEGLQVGNFGAIQVDQCEDSAVPFFFKQWGGVQKARTGRELDGRTWDEMPRIAHSPRSPRGQRTSLPVLAR